MRNIVTELSYTSVPNLLLLPYEFIAVVQQDEIAEIINQYTVFTKLVEIERMIQPIIESMEQERLLVSHKWFDHGLDSKREQLKVITAYLSKYTTTDGTVTTAQMIDYWNGERMPPAYTNKDLARYQHLHRTYDLMLEMKRLEQYLKQWGSGLLHLGQQSKQGILLRGHWQSYSSYTGRITARRLALTSIPNRLKNYVIPPEGYQIVSLDIHSAELRFLAYLAECEPMLTKFNSGQDVYMEIAAIIQSVVFQNEPVDELIARDLSKKYTFSMLYGASENTIRDNMRSVHPGIKTADISRVKLEFNQRYPEIIQFLSRREQSEELLTVYGKVRPLAIFSKTQKRNFTLQSSVAVAVKLLMIEAHKHLRVLHVIHDEIWLLAPTPTGKTLDESIKKITSQFYETIDDLLPDFPTTNLLSRQKIGGKTND